MTDTTTFYASGYTTNNKYYSRKPPVRDKHSNSLTVEKALMYAAQSEAKGYTNAAKVYLDTALRIEASLSRPSTNNHELLENSLAVSNLTVLLEWWPEEVALTLEENLSLARRKKQRLKKLREEEECEDERIAA